MAATEYWRAFVEQLATARDSPAEERQGTATQGKATEERTRRRAVERRAGVFYVSPCEAYHFAHPEATGRATSPFHGVWFCGGFGARELRAALRALKKLRRRSPRAIEVFRSAAMLQKRGHFTPS